MELHGMLYFLTRITNILVRRIGNRPRVGFRWRVMIAAAHPRRLHRGNRIILDDEEHVRLTEDDALAADGALKRKVPRARARRRWAPADELPDALDTRGVAILTRDAILTATATLDIVDLAAHAEFVNLVVGLLQLRRPCDFSFGPSGHCARDRHQP